MSGKGHPLPASGEARHNEIPEHIAREKGLGADAEEVVQPDREAVHPDGQPYPTPDLGRGPGSGGDDIGEDQAAHQDRGQSVAEAESDES